MTSSVDLSVTGSLAAASTFLAVGQEPGSTSLALGPLGSLELGL